MINIVVQISEKGWNNYFPLTTSDLQFPCARPARLQHSHAGQSHGAG